MTSFLYALLILLLVAATAYFFFPKQLMRLLLVVGRRAARLRAKTVVVDGEVWHYLEGGPADAETILFVHGFGTDKDSWVLYARQFTHEYRVVAPDLPGFGDSARHLDRDHTVRAQTANLHTFVTALGLEKFHIAGISMGGHISGLYALSYPELPASLVLLDNAGIDVPAKSVLLRAVDSGENPLAVSTMEEFEQMIDLVTYKPPPIPGIVRRYMFELAAKNREFNDRVFWAIVDEMKQKHCLLNDRLGEIRMPTLIIWGRHDDVIDVSCVEVMTAGIPDSAAVILEDTGHAPTIECPVIAAGHHKQFLATI